MTVTQQEPPRVQQSAAAQMASDTAGYAARAVVPGRLRRLDASGWPSLAARLIVGGVMVSMAIPKILDPVMFLKLMNQYEMVPEGWHLAMNSVVVVLPWIELLGGAFLVAGAGLRGVATLMLVMLIGFSAVIFLRAMDMLRAGEFASFFAVKFDCGCGGGEQIIWLKLLSNLGLMLLCGWLMWSRSRRFAMQ